MTKQEKLKMGLGIAASVGAGALVTGMLTPYVDNVHGGRIMKILAFFGIFALVGAAADVASTQMDKTVDTIHELPGFIKELGQK